jgi:hypothetical protein
MLINAQGYYTFCFNDIRHRHSIGHVASLSLRQALKVRESKEADAAISAGAIDPESRPASHSLTPRHTWPPPSLCKLIDVASPIVLVSTFSRLDSVRPLGSKFCYSGPQYWWLINKFIQDKSLTTCMA